MPMAKDPEKIASGFTRTQGPVFSRLGYLLFADFPHRIIRWEKGKTSVFREESHGASGLTFDHQGRLLAAESGRITRTEKNGSITVLAKTAGQATDLMYAIDGSIYFTAGGLFQITRDGKVRKVAGAASASGVALSSNQLQLYLSAGPEVHRFEVAGDGALDKGKLFATLPAPAGGLKTDETGNVWVATRAGIHTLDRTGAAISDLPLPEEPVNLNWGAGFHDLYVTSGTSVYRVPCHCPGTRTY